MDGLYMMLQPHSTSHQVLLHSHMWTLNPKHLSHWNHVMLRHASVQILPSMQYNSTEVLPQFRTQERGKLSKVRSRGFHTPYSTNLLPKLCTCSSWSTLHDPFLFCNRQIHRFTCDAREAMYRLWCWNDIRIYTNLLLHTHLHMWTLNPNLLPHRKDRMLRRAPDYRSIHPSPCEPTSEGLTVSLTWVSIYTVQLNPKLRTQFWDKVLNNIWSQRFHALWELSLRNFLFVLTRIALVSFAPMWTDTQIQLRRVRV